MSKSKNLIAEHDFGGFIVKVYFSKKKISESYVSVTTQSGIFEQRVSIGLPAYDFIFSRATSGEWEDIEAWCAVSMAVSGYFASEQEYADDIIAACNAFNTRLMAKGEVAASEVSDNDEIVAEAEMRDAIAYSDMGKSERKERKDVMRAEFKQLLDEFDRADAEADEAEKAKVAKKTKNVKKAKKAGGGKL